jgi:formylmethanofuran--tetrahydromethanopterin N-formyltransferase
VGAELKWAVNQRRPKKILSSKIGPRRSAARLAARDSPDDDGSMHIGPTEILDEHAEAFSARYARLVVTAIDAHRVDVAARAASGYATSIIGCDCEAGIDRVLSPSETPDGRPGVALLLFAFTAAKLADGLANRVGQCVLTCPTTACFNGLPGASETIPLGDWIHAFGDGYERREQGARSGEEISARWRIPVMDGEFTIDAVAGVEQGIGGGNLVLQSDSQSAALAAAQRAAGALAPLPNIITPFPAGICRSGSKVGSRDGNLIATTDEAYCPTLRDEAPSKLVAGATCAYEIVIDGTELAAVRDAMRTAIEAASGPGVLAIGARSFGGKLGNLKIGLHDLFA